MDVGLLFIGLVTLGAGGGFLALARRSGSAVERYLKTRLGDLASRPEGAHVGVRATIRCDKPLVDPATQEPCVYYRVALYETAGIGPAVGRGRLSVLVGGHEDHHHRRLMHETVERAEDFWLEDETGRVRVDARDYRVDGCSLDAVDREGALRHYGMRSSGFDAEHACLPVGRPAFVEGHLVHRGGERWLVGPQLAVDGRSAGFHRVSAGLLATVAVLVLALGAALAVAGALRPGEPEAEPISLEPQPLKPPAPRPAP